MDTSGRRITPSRPDMWWGTATSDPRGYTIEQLASLEKVADRAARAIRRFELPERYVVRRVTKAHWQHAALDETGEFPCPVVSATRDRAKLCVIAPNGMEEWVAWKK